MRKEMLTCREVVEFLNDYLDGELSEDRRREFERHLADCPDCTAYLETYRLTVELSKGALASPAEEVFDARLVAAVLAACRE